MSPRYLFETVGASIRSLAAGYGDSTDIAYRVVCADTLLGDVDIVQCILQRGSISVDQEIGYEMRSSIDPFYSNENHTKYF